MLRNALTSLGGPSSLRRTVLAPILPAKFHRQLQTSSPALKKRRAQEVEEDFDTSDETDELSLFDDAEAASTPGVVVDRQTQRANIKQSITAAVAAKGKERREAATAMRIGSLRKVVQLSDSAEEAEELRSLLRTWRVLGQKVTTQTATEIVGRCCNLGRPDLAQEFLKDRVQFGFPEVSPASQKKLDAALASFSAAPPPSTATEQTAST